MGKSFAQHTVTITVSLEGAYLVAKIGGVAKVFDHFGESGNGMQSKTESIADMLNGRRAVLAGFLFTIEGDNQRSGLSAGQLDNLDGFAHGRAGSYYIIDDDHPAGTSVGEAVEIIESAGARPIALAIALDREEKISENGRSAVQDFRDRLGLTVHAIAKFSTLIEYLRNTPNLGDQVGALEAYRDRYGMVGE